MTQEVTGGTPAVEAPKDDIQQISYEPPAVEAPKAETTEQPEAKAEVEQSAPEGREGEKPKRPTGYQRKILKLEQKIAQLERQQPQQQAEQPKPLTPPVPPKPEDFQDWQKLEEAKTQYTKDYAAYSVQSALQDAKVKEAQQRDFETLKQKVERFEVQKEELRKERPDLDELLEDYAGPSSEQMYVALVDTDHPAKIALYLAENPQEAAKMNGMGVMALNKFMAKLDAKMEIQQAQKPAAPATTTKAPPPVKPVGSGKGSVEKDPWKMNGDEYLAWEREQRRKR